MYTVSVLDQIADAVHQPIVNTRTLEATRLTLAERRTFERAERTIARGLKSFIQVGLALLEIRDAKLYRERYGTFEEYCVRRWELSRPRAYELCGASEVMADLSAIADTRLLPENEAQARPLTRLKSASHRQRAWLTALDLAAKEKCAVTARHVEAAIATLNGRGDRANGVPVFDPVRGVRATFRLLTGDARDLLRDLPPRSIDLILTSPPYANARRAQYGGPAPADFVQWFEPIAAEIKRVLKPSGTFILNIKERVVDGERHTYVIELILRMREQGWLWTEEWIWHKMNCAPGKWPSRFRDSWERLLQFNLERNFKMNQEAVMVPIGGWAGGRLKNLSLTDEIRDPSKSGSNFGKKVANWIGRDKVYPTNELHLATECGNKKHPAAFPRSLPIFFIKLFTDVGGSVLDPFQGSGTVGAEAVRLGRNYIGIDLSPEYTRIAEQAIQAANPVRSPTLARA